MASFARDLEQHGIPYDVGGGEALAEVPIVNALRDEQGCKQDGTTPDWHVARTAELPYVAIPIRNSPVSTGTCRINGDPL